jgi:hypothetical protein
MWAVLVYFTVTGALHSMPGPPSLGHRVSVGLTAAVTVSLGYGALIGLIVALSQPDATKRQYADRPRPRDH